MKTLVTLLLLGATAVADPICDRYSTVDRLPNGFVEIASGDLGKAELFVLTDGSCTCSNAPFVNRRLGKSAPDKINWSCRTATDGERRSN
jgi:hypothetical protein